MDRNIRANALRRILESFGLTIRGGDGSEWVVKRANPPKLHTIGHHGKNPEIRLQVVQALRRKFSLRAEDGVSDDDSYDRAWSRGAFDVPPQVNPSA